MFVCVLGRRQEHPTPRSASLWLKLPTCPEGWRSLCPVLWPHGNTTAAPAFQSVWFGQSLVCLLLYSDESRSVLMQMFCYVRSLCSDHYLSTVTWATDERIAVQWQNRTQSHVILQMYELSGEAWSGKTVTCHYANPQLLQGQWLWAWLTSDLWPIMQILQFCDDLNKTTSIYLVF